LPAIKISETPAKTPNPGRKQVWRVYDVAGRATADVMALDDEQPQEAERLRLHHPLDPNRFRTLHRRQISYMEPLLVEVMRDGRVLHTSPSIEEMRGRREEDLARLDPGVKRLINPHIYHVSLSEKLFDLKQQLISEARRG
jgi:nicotinate phosphoribosyltransferase